VDGEPDFERKEAFSISRAILVRSRRIVLATAAATTKPRPPKDASVSSTGTPKMWARTSARISVVGHQRQALKEQDITNILVVSVGWHHSHGQIRGSGVDHALQGLGDGQDHDLW
jgi:hypothetical protein